MLAVGPTSFIPYCIYLTIQHLTQLLHRVEHDVTLAHDCLVLRSFHSRAGRLDTVHFVDGAAWAVGGNQGEELAAGEVSKSSCRKVDGKSTTPRAVKMKGRKEEFR
jgi:hypothetical protein